MAILSKPLSPQLIQSAQLELGRFLANDPAIENLLEVSLHEYFPIYVVDAVALADDTVSENMLWTDYSRANARWHIQVHARGRPVGFANVLQADTPRVVAYTRTDIAADIDRCIDIADAARLPDSLYARLIEIPSLRVSALLLAPQRPFNASDAYVIFFELPIQQSSMLKFTLYPSSEALRKLRSALRLLKVARTEGLSVKGPEGPTAS